MKKITEGLFDYSDQVKFYSQLSVEETISCLSIKTKKPDLMILLASDVRKQTLVGRVTKDEVVLHRVTPLLGNFFKPYFFGKFENQNGTIVLEGIFTMRMFAKIVLSTFIAILIIVEAVILFVATGPEPVSVLVLYQVPAMAVLLFCLLIFSRWLSGKDVEWISNEIKSALDSAPRYQPQHYKPIIK